jgi:hypothetical protein
LPPTQKGPFCTPIQGSFCAPIDNESKDDAHHGSLFRINVLILAGFVVMGLTLTLNRMGQAGKLFKHRLDGSRDGVGVRGPLHEPPL